MVYEATLPIAQLVSRHRIFLFQLLKCFTSGDFLVNQTLEYVKPVLLY